MTTLGDRLKTERKRFKLTQTVFASIGGIGKNMQFRYEHNQAVPDANYLINLSKYGVDINYVLFGNNGGCGEVVENSVQLNVNLDDLIGVPIYMTEENKPSKDTEMTYLPKRWFIQNNLPSRDIVVVVNDGEAMSPDIKNNEWVIADTNKKHIGNGSTIAFRIGHRVLVNYLQYQGECLLVSGVNRAFPAYKLELSSLKTDFEIIGRVIASLNRW